MASDQRNIAIIRASGGTDAQALTLNHTTRYDGESKIDAVWIDDHFVSVDSIEFADYVSGNVDDGLTMADYIAMYG